jgi:Carboxypeptidase regulatory-like domain
MLPAPVTFSGVVTDGSGAPITDVSIDHTGSRSGIVKTDSQGKFEITTRAPAVVFRKDGFQSRYLRVEAGKSVGLSIRLDGPAPEARECGTHFSCSSLKYFGSTFCLPKVRGVIFSNQSNDVDYGKRVFWIAATARKVGLLHGAGPMWGEGLPLDEDIWTATEYREMDYRDRDGFLIVDARGRSSDGKHWRELGHVFESASYRGVSDQDAILLDRLLDATCVLPRRFGAER